MHKSLTETLHLRRTAVAVRHQRKVAVHTRVPATISYYAFIGLKVADIKALAGGAHKGTRTTAQAGLTH